MVKLSFIVPVYNVEQYLRKCVDSLLAQDYFDYEIILIDDGSTDNSGTICDEYASPSFVNSLTRSVVIKVLHQQNGGLSAARNAGLKVSNGEYVCFVDSDDYWEENVLRGMIEQAERENLDVLRFDHQNVRIAWNGENDGRYEVFEPNKSPRYTDKKNEVVDGVTYLNTRMKYACYAWQFVIRRSLLVEHEGLKEFENECLFTEGIHFEDVEWLPRMMMRAKRVNSTITIVYNYLVRQGSITKTQGDKTKIRKNIEDSLLIINRYKQYRKQYPDCTWLYNMQSSMVAGVLTTIARTFYDERNKYVARLNEMNVFPLSIANQDRTYERRALIVNFLGSRIFCAIMHCRS